MAALWCWSQVLLFRLLVVVGVLLLVAPTVEARAATVSVEFCGWYQTNYTDVDSVETDDLDDDYFRDNANKPARGALVQIINNDVPPHLPVNVYFEDAAASDACLTILLNDSYDYDIWLIAEAYVGGNIIRVLTCDGSTNPPWQAGCSNPDAVWGSLVKNNWVPNAGPETLTTAGLHEAWNIAAAAGHAMYRRDACLESELFVFYTQECPDVSSASCQRENALYIEEDGWNKKFTIAHEFGHAVAEASNGWDDEDGDDGGGFVGRCNSGLIRREYASQAASEGIAWYYAAVAFNSSVQSDCEIHYVDDYDGDNFPGETTNNERNPSCEGDLNFASFPTSPAFENWDNLDFLQYCFPDDDIGTRFDWMRAFWDADQGQSLTTCQIFDLWDRANPNNWDPNGGGTSGNDPQERMEAAADDAGVLTQWNNVDGPNGIR